MAVSRECALSNKSIREQTPLFRGLNIPNFESLQWPSPFPRMTCYQVWLSSKYLPNINSVYWALYLFSSLSSPFPLSSADTLFAPWGLYNFSFLLKLFKWQTYDIFLLSCYSLLVNYKCINKGYLPNIFNFILFEWITLMSVWLGHSKIIMILLIFNGILEASIGLWVPQKNS